MNEQKKQVRVILSLKQPPVKVLELLHEQVEGFDTVKWRDEETGGTILHWGVHAGRLTLLRLLLGRGVDTNAADLAGCTPLCLACRCGRLDMVKVLVGHGADVRTANFSATLDVWDGEKSSEMLVPGITALACALSSTEPTEMVHYLLAQGARTDSTALALALDRGLPTVQALLATETEGSFDSPFYQRAIIKVAKRKGNRKILGTLLKAGPPFVSAQLRDNIVMEAVIHVDIPLIGYMYDAGWRLNDGMWGRWLLFLGACGAANIDLLEYLLFTVGCDPNGPVKNYMCNRMVDYSVLHAACQPGTLEHLALLIWAGADIDALDTSGVPPMAYALHGVSKHPRQIFKYLMYCGVDPTRVQPTAEQRAALRQRRQSLIQHLAKNGVQLCKETEQQVQEEHERVVCGIQRRVRARVKARCRSPRDFYALLCAVRSEPAPLMSQTAVDRSIDRFYSQRDAAAQGVGDSMAYSEEARTCPLSSVVTRDSVVAADGSMYARAAIKSWIEECLREDGVVVSPTTGQVMSSTILLPAWIVAV